MDSESDWDSLTEGAASPRPKDGPPKIELNSGDENVSPRRPKPRQHGMNKEAKLKNQQNSEKEVNVRNPQGNEPPYDFSEEVKGDTDSPSVLTTQPPGKSQKGNLYEPGQWRATSHARKSSWDSDNDDNNILAELRETYTKNSPRSPFRKAPTPAKPQRQSIPVKQDQMQRPNMDAMKEVDVMPKSKSQVGEDDGDVILGVPMRNLHQNQDGLNPDVLQIQMSLKNKGSEPDGNVVDSYGNKRYYLYDGPTTDYARTNLQPDEPKAKMDEIADVVEKWIHRAWREFFGVLRIIVSFVFIFALEWYKFSVGQMLMPCMTRLTNMTGDYVVKPFLTSIFNNFLQPCFIFWHNIGAGVGLILAPLIDIFKAAAGVIAKILMAFRLVTVSIDKRHIDHVDHVSHV